MIDENLPHDLRHFIPGHDVYTAAYRGWAGLRNGELLALAAKEGFDALVTLDSGIAYQQNFATLPIAVVVLQAPNNKLVTLTPLVPKPLDALTRVAPQTILRVK